MQLIVVIKVKNYRILQKPAYRSSNSLNLSSHQSRYKDLSNLSLSDQSWSQLYLFLYAINFGYKSKKLQNLQKPAYIGHQIH